MKVAVIGSGTSGVITAMRLIENNHAVDIYSDPNKSAINVGESTTPVIGASILHNLNLTIQELIDMDIASLKVGVKFIDWGVGNQFIHGFRNEIAFHFESVPFSETLSSNLKQIGITYIYENVPGHKENEHSITVNNREYDFVVYCTGWSNTDSVSEPLFESVNSAILFQREDLDEELNCTLHVATDDGWMFGLPFPKREITKHGYLYNNQFEPSEYLKKRLNDQDYVRQISWKPKACDVLIQSPRVAFNGNRLFFIEPLQALSLHYYDYFARQICVYLADMGTQTLGYVNREYHVTMIQYQLSVAFHYSFGSVKNSQFWDHIKLKGQQTLAYVSPFAKKKLFKNAYLTDKEHCIQRLHLSTIGTFDWRDVTWLYEGFTGEKIDDLFSEVI